MKRILALLLASAIVAFSALTFSSCTDKAEKEYTEAFDHVFSQVFEKNVEDITAEDYASVESFEILTYSETNTVTVALEGYDAIMNSETPDEEAAAKLIKTVDIKDKNFDDREGFKKLTGLKAFCAIYTSFDSFDFLSECKELEVFMVNSNFECSDYAVLENFPNLKKLEITEGSVDDLSVISKLTSLTQLSLDSVQNGEYNITDISFVSPLTNLTSLSLSSNMIYDLSALDSLKNLEYLNLAYNAGIDDVSVLAGLTNLKYIDLTQSLVKDLTPLTNFDPENFEVVILDLNSVITDWSPLDYLGKKVQGRPTGYVLPEADTSSETEEPTEEPDNIAESGNETEDNSVEASADVKENTDEKTPEPEKTEPVDENDPQPEPEKEPEANAPGTVSEPEIEVSVDTGEQEFEEGFGDNDIDVSIFDF